VQEQEQSADTVRQAIAREELGVLERESEQQAAAREDPAVGAGMSVLFTDNYINNVLLTSVVFTDN
jgi:hypothetical protein